MNKNEFLEEIKNIYTVIGALGGKPGKKVLRCRHKKLGRDIIIKLLSDDVPVCRFLCGIKHENLPEIYDVYELDDGFAVIEEYINGMNVGEIIKTGLYGCADARTVIRGVCSALSVLHENGFVHRDIKPENVIISDDGAVKLIDFDACRTYSEDKKTDTQILGTIGYAPPEQYGVSQSDGRSDIYAVGVLLNVMLTGRHPSEKLAAGKAGRIITKCTQINPDKRYQSAAALIRAL